MADDVRLRAILAFKNGDGSAPGGRVSLDAVERLFLDYASLPRSPRSCQDYLVRFQSFRKIHGLETYGELLAVAERYTLEQENQVRKACSRKKGQPRLKQLSPGGFKSNLRAYAAIFSKKALAHYRKNGLQLENPFRELDSRAGFEAFQSPPGGLGFVEKLQADAKQELADRPGLYLLFLLALGCGLRAQEATHVRWCDIRENHLFVRSDEVHRTKSGLSRMVPITPLLRDLIGSFRPKQSSDEDYVLPPMRALRKQTTKRGARGLCYTKGLGEWLKTKGIRRPLTTHPLHYLRKLFGAMIVTKHANGYALAKEYLGHQSITITEKIYVGLLEKPAPEIFKERNISTS
ncbi:MAG: tyrosine-type recombinase/integrase [Opitutales bacterium]